MRKKDISDAIGNINDRYIEEAADFQRKKKRTGKSSILQKSVAAAASFILVFILSVSTLVAADFSPAYEFLYTLSPSAAQKLKPVSMISEDNGIKIEVISAYVESGEAKILISVQDLEEDRIDETTDLFDSFRPNPFVLRTSPFDKGELYFFLFGGHCLLHFLSFIFSLRVFTSIRTSSAHRRWLSAHHRRTSSAHAVRSVHRRIRPFGILHRTKPFLLFFQIKFIDFLILLLCQLQLFFHLIRFAFGYLLGRKNFTR